MQGTLARAVTMHFNHPRYKETAVQTFPAGTPVWVTHVRDDGTCRVRLVGGLYEQTVRLASSVRPL